LHYYSTTFSLFLLNIPRNKQVFETVDDSTAQSVDGTRTLSVAYQGAGRAAATEPPGAQIYSAKIIDAVMCLAAEFKKNLYPVPNPRM